MTSIQVQTNKSDKSSSVAWNYFGTKIVNGKAVDDRHYCKLCFDDKDKKEKSVWILSFAMKFIHNNYTLTFHCSIHVKLQVATC